MAMQQIQSLKESLSIYNGRTAGASLYQLFIQTASDCERRPRDLESFNNAQEDISRNQAER